MVMMVVIMIMRVVIVVMMMVIMVMMVMVAIRAADMVLMAMLEELRIVLQCTVEVEGADVEDLLQIDVGTLGEGDEVEGERRHGFSVAGWPLAGRDPGSPAQPPPGPGAGARPSRSGG